MLERLVTHLGHFRGRFRGALSLFAMPVRRPESSVQGAETVYQQLVDNLREVVFQADATGRWLFLNAAWTNSFG